MAFALEADFLSRPALSGTEPGKQPLETDHKANGFKESLSKLDPTASRDTEAEILARTDIGQAAVAAILINVPQKAPEMSLIAEAALTAGGSGTELALEGTADREIDSRASDMLTILASNATEEMRTTASSGIGLPVSTGIRASPDTASQEISRPAAPPAVEAFSRSSKTVSPSGHTRIEPEVQSAPASAIAPLAVSVPVQAGSTGKTESTDAKALATSALATPASRSTAQTASANTSGRQPSGHDRSITHASTADGELKASTQQQAGTASFSDMVAITKPAASQDMSPGAQPIAVHAQAPQPAPASVAAVPVAAALTQTQALITATPAQIVDVISDSVAAPEDRKSRVIVQLDPPELGRISIDYKFDAQGLQHVTITGESPEAMRQLRLMHFELVNALEKQGLSSQNMSFQQHQANQDPDQQAPRTGQVNTETTKNQAPTVPVLIASQASQSASTSNGGLNIKL